MACRKCSVLVVVGGCVLTARLIHYLYRDRERDMKTKPSLCLVQTDQPSLCCKFLAFYVSLLGSIAQGPLQNSSAMRMLVT